MSIVGGLSDDSNVAHGKLQDRKVGPKGAFLYLRSVIYLTGAAIP
jgi:hypothetical protein